MCKKILCMLMAVAMIFSFTACQPKDNKDNKDSVNSSKAEIFPMTFTDDSGEEITLDKAPSKIASGAPSNTEIIYALGKSDMLIGVTDYCNFPEEALDKEKIGDYNGPNVEKLIELGADIIISDYMEPTVREQLKSAGVTPIIIAATTYEGVYDRIMLIGNITQSQAEAEKLVADMKNKTADILSKIKESEIKRVFYEVWHEPLMSAGPGSLIDEMITMCKAQNIAGDMESGYGEFSPELVIEKDPQVYLTADDGFKTADDIKARQGYSDLTAIKNNQIYFLDQDIISRPGPRIVEALELVAKSIYPQAFQ